MNLRFEGQRSMNHAALESVNGLTNRLREDIDPNEIDSIAEEFVRTADQLGDCIATTESDSRVAKMTLDEVDLTSLLDLSAGIEDKILNRLTDKTLSNKVAGAIAQIGLYRAHGWEAINQRDERDKVSGQTPSFAE